MFGIGALDERLNGSMGSTIGSIGSIGFAFLFFVGIAFIISCFGSWSSTYRLLGIGILGERLIGSTDSTIGLIFLNGRSSCSSCSTVFIKSSSLSLKSLFVIFSLLSPTRNKSDRKIVSLVLLH